MRNSKNRAGRTFWKGFTLAELIVVITILAILATIGFLALSGYSQDAKDSAVRANVRSVYTAIMTESALTGNSPRYYVIHDSGASISWGIVVFDGISTTLTGGDWNVPNTNYSAGNPDFAKLKINPEKFKISGIPAFLASAFHQANATYDGKVVTVGATDLVSAQSNGKRRSFWYVQVAGISPTTWTVSVAGNYPVGSSGSVAGLIKNPSSSSATWALTDSASVGKIAETYPNWMPDGSSWSYYQMSGVKKYPTSCSDMLTNSWTYFITGSVTASGSTFKDGRYWVDSDGAGGDDPYEAYCDVSGGAWWTYFPAAYCRPMPATSTCKYLTDNAYWTNANDFDQISWVLSYGSSYSWYANLKNVIIYESNQTKKETVCIKMPNADVTYNPTSVECAAYHQTFALNTDTVTNVELYKGTGNNDQCGSYLASWYDMVFTLQRNGKTYGRAIASPNNGTTGNAYKSFQSYWGWATTDAVSNCVPTNQTLW